MENKDATVCILYVEPIIEYSQDDGNDEDNQQSSTKQGISKNLILNKPDCQKKKEVHVDDKFLVNIKHEIYSKILSSEDDQKQVDLRAWLDPQIKVRVGIHLVAYFLRFVEKYHEILFIKEIKKNEKIESLKESIGENYSELAMTESFLSFLSVLNDNEELKSISESLKEYTDNKFPPILLLMNINGCLFHRTSQIIKFTRPTKGTQEAKEEKWRRQIKFFNNKKHFHYFRDGYLFFLRALMQHPRCKFAFYSAIMQKNISPILINMFEDDIGLYQENMFSIFDQQFCEPNSEITGEKFGFIRDLDKVWESQACKDFQKSTGITFGPENTLMLESDEENVYKFHQNSLIVDRFDRDDVWPAPDSKKPYRDQQKILNLIKQDLFKLLNKQSGDIREFLKNSANQEESVKAQYIQFSSYLKKARQMTLAQLNEEKQKKSLNDLDENFENLKI